MCGKGDEKMKRTVEKVFGIAAILCNLIAIGLGGLFLAGFKGIQNDPNFANDFANIQNEMKDPGTESVTPEDLQSLLDAISPFMGTFGWILIICFIISTVIGIAAMILGSKPEKAQLTGILLIVAGLFSGIITITSILFYIAAILFFVRKPSEEMKV